MTKISFGRSTLPIIAVVVLISLVSGTGAEGESTRVQDFLKRTYFHGIPYDEARSLGPQALPELEVMLHDDSLKPQWRKIVGIIGYIGAPKSFQILHDFMWERFSGVVDSDTWKALLNVPNVMGTIPDTPNAPVIAYLEQGTNPAFWDSLPWTESYHEMHGDLGVVLSRVSINGLACTGAQRAKVILKRLETHPFSPRQLSNVREGLEAHERIAKKGLATYLKEIREQAGMPGQQGKTR